MSNTRRTLRFRLSLLLMVILFGSSVGCDELEQVNAKEAETLKKFRTGDYELLKKEEVAQLRKDADTGKSVGRYQLYSRGFRTWRLDTSTGASCINADDSRRLEKTGYDEVLLLLVSNGAVLKNSYGKYGTITFSRLGNVALRNQGLASAKTLVPWRRLSTS